MKRRDFLSAAGLAASGAAAGLLTGCAPASVAALATNGPADTQSRRAWVDLLETLDEISRVYLSEERRVTSPQDIAEGYRLLSHLLQAGLFFEAEADAARPRFLPIVSPTRKLLGDNPDAIYHHAAVSERWRYWVRGNMAGAVYCSITIETGDGKGGYSSGVGAAINDTQLDIAKDGSFKLLLASRRPPNYRGNWLHLPQNAARITTRHYFEEKRSVAARQDKRVPLTIENTSDVAPPPPPNDETVAASLRRARNFIWGVTLGQPPLFQSPQSVPNWVSLRPNRFNQPAKPGKIAFAAVDNTYAMAPFQLKPDQALVITGSIPKCRFANIALWNRFLQTFDYLNRQTSLNRKQMRLDRNGRYRIVVAAKNPGSGDWIDTEGRPSGMMYWRFLLAEDRVPTPQTQVVPVASLSRR